MESNKDETEVLKRLEKSPLKNFVFTDYTSDTKIQNEELLKDTIDARS